MSIEEKKLLVDIKEAILSIDDHLEGKRLLMSSGQTKLNAGLWRGNLRLLGRR
jgi:hypothetical protein